MKNRTAVLKMKRRCIFTIILLLCIAIGYLICNAISIWIYGDVDETRMADTAVVLGAAADDSGVSPVFRERINHAVWLYQSGYVEAIIITGGYGKGNRFSDAYIGMQYAVEQGIPESAVLIEESSTVTEENLENAKLLMDNHNFGSALIVSDPLHMKRAMLQAKDKGIKAYSSPTPTSMYQGSSVKIKFLIREVFLYIGYKWYTLAFVE